MTWTTRERTIDVYRNRGDASFTADYSVTYVLRETDDDAECDGPYDVRRIVDNEPADVVDLDALPQADRDRILDAVAHDAAGFAHENFSAAAYRADPLDVYGRLS